MTDDSDNSWDPCPTMLNTDAPLVDYDNVDDNTERPPAMTMPETPRAAREVLAREVEERRTRVVRDGSAPLRRSTSIDSCRPLDEELLALESRCVVGAGTLVRSPPPRKPEESRSLTSSPGAGVKYDSGKPRFSLVPLNALRAVVRVLDAGARKYAPDNWRKVPDARRRYYDAVHRHIGEWWDGEKLDPETGEHHLAHAACCILFLLALDLEVTK